METKTHAAASRQHEDMLMPSALRFRLQPSRLAEHLAEFNQRREIQWFGFSGRYEAPCSAVIYLTKPEGGMLGGGGTDALNGGVIAAGFDAVCVLAAIAQYEVIVVVTLSLQIQFMRLARSAPRLQFRAQVLKSARHVCFVQAALISEDGDAGSPMVAATATATLAPR